GIDAGTQGLSLIFTDESLNVLAAGEGSYDMVSGLKEGCYEQHPDHWIAALKEAVKQCRDKFGEEMEVLAIGISGQMHGEVLADQNGEPLCAARLWCDARNDAEQDELTAALNVKMPKRITSARWLWTLRNRPEIASKTCHITTPAGWLAFQLTGQWNLGIGDAAGMFPIDQSTLNYNTGLAIIFDEIASQSSNDHQKILSLLPSVCTAGSEGGVLTESGAELLGLSSGIPVAPAEGDQPAALAGSLIGQAGMVSCSFGTSVCANSVGDRSFTGVSPAVDHFCAPDGKPINMVWLRNGTTYMNTVVEMFGSMLGDDRSTAFQSVMPKVLQAAPDCGGILALPFMDDEPGLGVSKGGTASLIGLNPENATPGNAVKAAILATMFNLKLGSQTLDQQGFPRTELVLSGGLTKTSDLAQVLADVFNTKVSLLASAEEGTAWGATLLAKYRYAILHGEKKSWTEFLSTMPNEKKEYLPDPEPVFQYDAVYQRYQSLVNAEKTMAKSSV
ncbi:MAG: FGGY family carbohydrate kinase, partial [Planctomycetota bacterium]